MKAIDNSDMDLSEVEIDQAVFDLKSFGTCRADALYGLIKRVYAACHKKWVKDNQAGEPSTIMTETSEAP